MARVRPADRSLLSGVPRSLFILAHPHIFLSKGISAPVFADVSPATSGAGGAVDSAVEYDLAFPLIRQIGDAFKNLDPEEMRALSNRSATLGILAADDLIYSRALAFLIPAETTEAKADQAFRSILRIAEEEDFNSCDVGFSERAIPHPPHFYPFDPHNPEVSVQCILDEHEDLWIPLSKRFLPFREPVIQRLIWKISKENAMFTVATSLPNIVPSVISLPWAVGEFASDTAFLTMNQVRMAFLIAAASDSPVGYREQRAEIGSIVAAAFGWRAIARELVSKIPAGGGLVSKGLISFAGSYAVGVGLDRLLRLGRGMTRDEKRHQYHYAYQRGREMVQQMVGRMTGRVSASPSSA